MERALSADRLIDLVVLRFDVVEVAQAKAALSGCNDEVPHAHIHLQIGTRERYSAVDIIAAATSTQKRSRPFRHFPPSVCPSLPPCPVLALPRSASPYLLLFVPPNTQHAHAQAQAQAHHTTLLRCRQRQARFLRNITDLYTADGPTATRHMAPPGRLSRASAGATSSALRCAHCTATTASPSVPSVVRSACALPRGADRRYGSHGVVASS